MKYFLLTVIFCVVAYLPCITFADEASKITLSIPDGFVGEVCKKPVWNNLPVKWEGTVDKRTLPEVGVQTQKGKEPQPIMAEPQLDKAFDAAIEKLLTTCGMKFVGKADDNDMHLSAEIREFYVGVKKGLVTGKSEAKSSLTFLSRRGGQSATVTVGTEIESKKIRSGNIKQLTSTLNELFTETLKQIPTTWEMVVMVSQ